MATLIYVHLCNKFLPSVKNVTIFFLGGMGLARTWTFCCSEAEIYLYFMASSSFAPPDKLSTPREPLTTSWAYINISHFWIVLLGNILFQKSLHSWKELEIYFFFKSFTSWLFLSSSTPIVPANKAILFASSAHLQFTVLCCIALSDIVELN